LLFPVVITGLDPVIHLLRKSLCEERWIAGSSPATTSKALWLHEFVGCAFGKNLSIDVALR